MTGECDIHRWNVLGIQRITGKQWFYDMVVSLELDGGINDNFFLSLDRPERPHVPVLFFFNLNTEL